MLLQFFAENFRSFREGQTLDLRANATKDLAEVVRRLSGLKADSQGVLPVIAVFGANASGKSSLFMAADFMRTAVLQSASSTVEGRGILEHVTTFRFDPDRRTSPVTFRVEFLLEGARHEYGFTLQPRRHGDQFTRVASEWLRTWPQSRVRDLFLRGDAARDAGHDAPWWISERSFHGGRRLAADLFEQTRDDVLFLSLASQRNHPRAKAVVGWFNDLFATTSARGQTTERQALVNPSFCTYVGRLLCAADTGLERIEVTHDEAQERAVTGFYDNLGAPFPIDVREFFSVRTFHRDRDGREVALHLEEESAGTQRLFALAGPIYDALRHGRCLWIDELDTAMHHWLVRTLIKLFQDPTTNPRGAQLLFTTHDAAVMDPTLLRRDQIWLVEKDAAQGSQIYSLVDIEDKPRKDQPLFKNFLSGRYGGVPRLDEAAILDWPGSAE
jgi:AAA15 family ATPase/GTPase